MAAEATPRINARYLETFTNSTVRILGRVTSLRGESATVDANGSIQVHLNRVSYPDAHLTLNNAVEIIGKVQPDLSVKVFQAMDFGSNIDFNAVEAVVDATHRYKEIFYNAD
ncbi:MAG: hypothetical protein LQ348_002285 [Seirophora lacunosa]|nr:MAG: hypothetical protein LQ348_002285 [Seirophora lacunosa]